MSLFNKSSSKILVNYKWYSLEGQFILDTIHDNIREHTIKRNREEDRIHNNRKNILRYYNRTNIIRCYSMEEFQDLTIPMNH